MFPQELNQPEDEVSEQSNRDGFQPLFAVEKGIERKVGKPNLHRNSAASPLNVIRRPPPQTCTPPGT